MVTTIYVSWFNYFWIDCLSLKPSDLEKVAIIRLQKSNKIENILNDCTVIHCLLEGFFSPELINALIDFFANPVIFLLVRIAYFITDK